MTTPGRFAPPPLLRGNFTQRGAAQLHEELFTSSRDTNSKPWFVSSPWPAATSGRNSSDRSG